MEKEYFLITSYTGGQHSELKSKHLIKFLQQIRHYINNSFIVVIDSNYVKNVEKYCDLYVHKLDNFDIPHGEGELAQIKLGLSLLENYNINFFVKFNYDYWMNDDIYNSYLNWKNLIKEKKIVGCVYDWNREGTEPNSFACSCGVYQMDAAKKLFSFQSVSYPIEIQLFNEIQSLFDSEEIIIYPDLNTFFGSRSIDFFADGGKGCHFDLINQVHNNINN